MKHGIIILLLITANAFAQIQPHPADPEIQAIVDQISADSLLYNVTMLQNFFTRHTFSDTASTTVGIGAAMRWVEAVVDTHDTLNQISFEWFPWSQGQTRHILIARRSGVATERGRYIIGGHLDSRNANGSDNVGFAPGANDNASSCAGFIEMARLLPLISTEHDVELIWFTGEEQGLWGSAAYANHLANNDERVDGMIAMDINGRITDASGNIDSTSLRLYAEGAFNQGGTSSPSRRLQRYIKWVGEAYVPGHEMTIFPAPDRPGRGSDHLSFSGAGYAGVRFIETNENVAFQHNTTDIVDHYVPSYGRKNMICAMSSLVTMLKSPLAPPAPGIESPGDGNLHITIPDSVLLEDGGNFYLAVRNWNDSYWDSVYDVGADWNPFICCWTTPGEIVYVSLSRSNAAGFPSPFSEETEIEVQYIDATNDISPTVTSLAFSASPNPFNSTATINYELPVSSDVRIVVYDLLGRETAILLNQREQQGTHIIHWTPENLAGGIYFVRLEAGKEIAVKKILYLK